MMMDHVMNYASKSPEKSSPSFPEDVEDDDEDPMDLEPLKYSSLRQHISSNNTTNNESTHNSTNIIHTTNGNNNIHHTTNHCDDDDVDEQLDVTMLPPEDEDDDLGGPTRGFMANVDSPRHPTDSTEKKVHWSNQNVQTLLDCVEKHLDEFNIQKKHKQVWQIIGTEMESLGFTMEHCYNKWKNLRRDVRLLVNNPQKAVRNADILRRVARLILVIYPNIDATTMQVTGDRISTSKSTPNTPGGPGSISSTRLTLSSSLHAPDSPLYFGLSRTRTPHSLTPNFHSSNSLKYKTEQSSYDTTTNNATTTPVPGTALFTSNLRGSDSDSKKIHLSSTPNSTNHENNNTSTTISQQANSGFPFFFNPAAAALLVQSQLFNDLLRQQTQLHDDSTMPLDSIQQREQFFALTASLKNALHSTTNSSNSTTGTPTQHTTTNINNGSNGSKNIIANGDFNTDNNNANNSLHVASLASNLLNGLNGLDTSQYLNLLASEAGLLNGTTSHPNNYNSNNSNHPHHPQQSQQQLYTSISDRLPPGSELAGVVQRLLNEETIHLRLTDMVTHLADELRAAGLRRRATLDQLLEIMQGGSGTTATGCMSSVGATNASSINHTHKNSDTTHRV
ncbi:hypothetical protein MN116_000029 [Schistosoma mekongi]|uniref:Myb-like domain-containing protein n=1 Tax=Schistosoma mekongi TaxID=38744 RepID=A0AAE2D3D3_SCHME|nr:hypothetical protein MN116_000029 [Schistosoma mekongi]